MKRIKFKDILDRVNQSEPAVILYDGIVFGKYELTTLNKLIKLHPAFTEFTVVGIATYPVEDTSVLEFELSETI